ncbi:hypothetical protein M8J77_010162 [Diaphorina citri]|nr:hypothetical protein M8J77_010162 [Diaphorina citri]
MAEDEDGMLPKLEPEIKLEAVSTPDVHAMASDVIHDGYAANDLDTMFDAQDQYPWKPPTTTVQYVPGRGVARYKSALKTLIPIRKNKKRKVIGVDSAGFLSFISYSWMNELMLSAYRKATITVNELPHCSPWDTCSYNSERLDKMWQEEVARKGPQDASLGGVVWRFIRTRILFATFIYSLYVAMGFASPAIFLRNLLVYSETPDAPTSDGIFWALCLILSEILRIVFVTWVWAMNYRTATRLRAACMGLLYKKVIRLNSLGNKSVGELINLFSNDSQRIYDMTLFAPLIAGGPLTLLLGGYYIYWLLSPWALSGILVFIIFYPVQYGLSKLTSHYRGKTYSTTDERIKIISEVISFIKLIKMYAWEKNFARKLDDTRRRELEYIKNTSYFQSLGLSIGPTAPVISAITSFVAHIASGNNLTASQAFSLVTIVNAQMRLAFFNLRVGTENIIDSNISFNRIKSILLMEEVNVYVSKPIDKSSAVSIAGGSFLWDTLLDSSKTSGSKRKKYAAKSKEKSNGEESTHLKAEDVERNIALVDINFFAPKGKLVGICGAVGSGKSALLYAILSQLRSTAGKLSREGTCAYVSQEAWITNDTLRHNILFGEPFEPQRYYKTLYNCALNTDIHILPGGDQTEIGERGINLSGGQKQRVALARALYSNRDIYVLDDPFSALDTEVASHIFRHCILDTLGSRTVILVSNQIQYLSKCSLIYVLKDGRIFESGTHDDLLSKNGEYFSLSSLGKLKVGSPDPMEGGEGKPPPNSNISYISPTAAVQNGKTGEILVNLETGWEILVNLETGWEILVNLETRWEILVNLETGWEILVNLETRWEILVNLETGWEILVNLETRWEILVNLETGWEILVNLETRWEILVNLETGWEILVNLETRWEILVNLETGWEILVNLETGWEILVNLETGWEILVNLETRWEILVNLETGWEILVNLETRWEILVNLETGWEILVNWKTGWEILVNLETRWEILVNLETGWEILVNLETRWEILVNLETGWEILVNLETGWEILVNLETGWEILVNLETRWEILVNLETGWEILVNLETGWEILVNLETGWEILVNLETRWEILVNLETGWEILVNWKTGWEILVNLETRWEILVNLETGWEILVNLETGWEILVNLETRWEILVNLETGWEILVNLETGWEILVNLETGWEILVNLETRWEILVNLETGWEILVNWKTGWEILVNLETRWEILVNLETRWEILVNLETGWEILVNWKTGWEILVNLETRWEILVNLETGWEILVNLETGWEILVNLETRWEILVNLETGWEILVNLETGWEILVNLETGWEILVNLETRWEILVNLETGWEILVNWKTGWEILVNLETRWEILVNLETGWEILVNLETRWEILVNLETGWEILVNLETRWEILVNLETGWEILVNLETRWEILVNLETGWEILVNLETRWEILVNLETGWEILVNWKTGWEILVNLETRWEILVNLETGWEILVNWKTGWEILVNLETRWEILVNLETGWEILVNWKTGWEILVNLETRWEILVNLETGWEILVNLETRWEILVNLETGWEILVNLETGWEILVNLETGWEILVNLETGWEILVNLETGWEILVNLETRWEILVNLETGWEILVNLETGWEILVNWKTGWEILVNLETRWEILVNLETGWEILVNWKTGWEILVNLETRWEILVNLETGWEILVNLETRWEILVNLETGWEILVNLETGWEILVNLETGWEILVNLETRLEILVNLETGWEILVNLETGWEILVNLETRWEILVNLETRWEILVNLETRWEILVNLETGWEILVNWKTGWEILVNLETRWEILVNLETGWEILVNLETGWEILVNLETRWEILVNLETRWEILVNLETGWEILVNLETRWEILVNLETGWEILVNLETGWEILVNWKTGWEILQAEAKLTTIEDKVTGNISKDTLYAYIRATGGVCLTLVAALSVLINVGSTSFSSWWLAVWLKAGGGNITEVQGNETVTYHSDHINANPDFYMYQTVYASTIGIIILTSLLRSFIFTKVSLKASHTLHAVLFKKMLYSPLSFFEETPSGRIQNYFTKDMFEVDSRLPYSLESSIQNMWSMLFAFLMICFVFPWFALPLLIITTLYHLISKVFRIAVRELKRMENVSRSPIFSNVSSTVSGLHIIHVFHKEQDFVRRFCEQYDENSTTLFLCSMAMRWLAVRIDVLAVIAMAIITGLTVAFHGSVSPALAGLALTYASHVTGLLQFTVRVFVETELNFLAVERINNCSKKLVPEGRGPITSEFGQVKVKLADWPRQGTIKFKNVSLRYRDNWPLVLANVSFRINHGENIGIVGRTGAGKSSLLVALFRLVELSSGQIKIDDFDIASVELETLRSRLSVIPQDPVLFNGTIRYNLDPFGRCHDTELWDALEKSHLKSKVVTMRSKLDSDVQGDQLSLGEKQLLCLARALLRKTKAPKGPENVGGGKSGGGGEYGG